MKNGQIVTRTYIQTMRLQDCSSLQNLEVSVTKAQFWRVLWQERMRLPILSSRKMQQLPLKWDNPWQSHPQTCRTPHSWFIVFILSPFKPTLELLQIGSCLVDKSQYENWCSVYSHLEQLLKYENLKFRKVAMQTMIIKIVKKRTWYPKMLTGHSPDIYTINTTV